jgi:hypothetical protein
MVHDARPTRVVVIRYPEPLVYTQEVDVGLLEDDMAMQKAKRMARYPALLPWARFWFKTVHEDTYHPPAAVCTNWALWGTLPALKEHA